MIRKNRAIPTHEIKLLIFDLDGTLVDSRIDLANSVNAMLRHYSRPELPPDVIASYIGNGAPMLVRRSLGDPDDEKFVQEALLYFMAYYREHKLDTTYVYKGIKESLDAIVASRNGSSIQATQTQPIHPQAAQVQATQFQATQAFRMAVLSNKPVGPSRGIVEALGLGQYFFQVYGGNSFHTKKPDPTGVQALLEEAEAGAHETVIIGDSDVDIITARNAGAYSLGVTYGLAPHTLEDAPPDVLIDHPHELATVLGRRDQGRLTF
jgi:phosphoglycolate phosphatase